MLSIIPYKIEKTGYLIKFKKPFLEMRCSYCKEPAKCKCSCIKSYMCEKHFGKHLIENENHEFEKLEISLEETEMLHLKSKIIEKLKKVKFAKKDLCLQTNLLLIRIQNTHKNAEDLLNKIIKEYLEILQHNKFCRSEMPKVEEIRNAEISAKITEFYEIKHLLERFYPRVRIEGRKF